MTVTPRSYVQVVNNQWNDTLSKQKVKRVSFSESALAGKERNSTLQSEGATFELLQFITDPPVAHRPSPRRAMKRQAPAWSAWALLV